MNVFTIARECFNEPEQYSIVSTRAQIYASLLSRGVVDREEYFNLIDDLRAQSSDRFVNENRYAVNAYFQQIKKAVDL